MVSNLKLDHADKFILEENEISKMYFPTLGAEKL